MAKLMQENSKFKKNRRRTRIIDNSVLEEQSKQQEVTGKLSIESLVAKNRPTEKVLK